MPVGLAELLTSKIKTLLVRSTQTDRSIKRHDIVLSNKAKAEVLISQIRHPPPIAPSANVLSIFRGTVRPFFLSGNPANAILLIVKIVLVPGQAIFAKEKAITV